jgi:hypothetical protein
VEQDPSRVRPAASEVDLLQASYAKATALTGWVPAGADGSGLIAGLTKTVEWFRDPKNLVRYKAQIYNI